MATKELMIESPKYGRHVVLYDDADVEKIEPYNWYIDMRSNTAYVKRNLPRIKSARRPSPVLMHNELMGPLPQGCVVDHHNRNGLDNRRTNLRIVTRSQNMMNREKTRQNSTGYKGGYKTGDSKRNPYSTKIQKDYEVYYLGHYKTAEEAHEVRKKKEEELFREFAPLTTTGG